MTIKIFTAAETQYPSEFWQNRMSKIVDSGFSWIRCGDMRQVTDPHPSDKEFFHTGEHEVWIKEIIHADRFREALKQLKKQIAACCHSNRTEIKILCTCKEAE